jgi:hypothetical protein
MSDIIVDTLRSVRASKIEVVLSESQVISGIPLSGLWPRVTIEIQGKSRTFPMTEYGSTRKIPQRDGTKATTIEKEVLLINGSSSFSKAKLHKAGREMEFNKTVLRIHLAIDHAIRKARSKGPMAERHARASRRQRKTQFLEKFRQFCSDHARGIHYADISPHELAQVWDEIRRTKVASEVMDS